MTDNFYMCPNCLYLFHPKDVNRAVLKTATFVRKPLVVDGVQVTEENMNQVAEWCSGKVQATPSKRNFIKLQTKPTAPTRQAMAFVGDWVLKSDVGFKFYSKRAFERTFDPHNS